MCVLHLLVKMVNMNTDRARRGVCNPSENQCHSEIKDRDISLKSSLPSCCNRRSVLSKLLKDGFKVKTRGKRPAREKVVHQAARKVGYSREQYSKPFTGRARDFKAIITAVKFKQLLLKNSLKTDYLKKAILTNTMKRAEDDLFIQGRQRQLRRAQAHADAQAEELRISASVPKPEVDPVKDEAIKSLEMFLEAISAVTR